MIQNTTYMRIATVFVLFILLVSCKSETKSGSACFDNSGGIVFFRTTQLDSVIQFYTSKVDCEIWYEKENCKILKHGNMLIGFCQSDVADTSAMITFFYNSQQMVDDKFNELQELATTEPVIYEKYNIYQFFATDPDNRNIEFQYFLDSIKAY